MKRIVRKSLLLYLVNQFPSKTNAAACRSISSSSSSLFLNSQEQKPILSGRNTKFSNSAWRFVSTYKAARIKEFSTPLILEDLKRKPLKPDEVRIGVYCCGINSIDVSNCYGELTPKPSLPFVPGYEVKQ